MSDLKEYAIVVKELTERADGSAGVVIDMGPKAAAVVFEEGIRSIIRKAIEQDAARTGVVELETDHDAGC